MSLQEEKLLKSYLPMSEASFLILSSLWEERHGYAVMHEAARLTGGRVSLGAGTVYTILSKMEGDHLIETVREEERRKIYRMTPVGKMILLAECRRLEQLAAIAGSFLGECAPAG